MENAENTNTSTNATEQGNDGPVLMKKLAGLRMKCRFPSVLQVPKP